jgi:CxxC-x17-CxxC domain-containing protein
MAEKKEEGTEEEELKEEEQTEEETADEQPQEEATEEGSEEKKDRFGRELHKVKCSECGRDTEVPFKPSGDRPVYCRDCYQKHRSRRRF